MTPDVADLIDRLDLSMSSIDMTNTALAMHEEKECEMSGVGKLGHRSLFILEWPKGILTVFISYHAEELEDSTLSSSADIQDDPPVPRDLAARDLSSPLTSSVNVSYPDIQPADPPHLHAQCIDAPPPSSESSNRPPANTAAPSVTVEDPASTPPPVDLLQFSGMCEPAEDRWPGQEVEDAPAEDKVDPGDGPHSSHEHDGEDPEE